MKIAVIQIILGRYDIFWDRFFLSCEKYFCKDDQKDYFIFTDRELEVKNKSVKLLKQDYLGWPFSTLYRYHIILRIEDELKKYDSIVFFNANTFFVQEIKYLEFFGDKNKTLVAGIHPIFAKNSVENLPIEKRIKSACHIQFPLFYVQGCINGGKSKTFIEIIKKMKNMIDSDLSKGLLSIWHDESYWNFIINEEYVRNKDSLNILNFEYLFPSNFVKKNKNINPKILMISKENYGNIDNFRNNIHKNKNLIKRIFSKVFKLLLLLKQKLRLREY